MNNPFCYDGKTEGCKYATHQNPYLPEEYPTSLEMKPDDFSNSVITTVNAGKQEKVKVIAVLFSESKLHSYNETIAAKTINLATSTFFIEKDNNNKVACKICDPKF